MTKKKFIKEVMSYCIQRNEAKKLATCVDNYGSYIALFTYCRFKLVNCHLIKGFEDFNRLMIDAIHALENFKKRTDKLNGGKMKSEQ